MPLSEERIAGDQLARLHSLVGRFLPIGGELVSGPGCVDVPGFRFEEAAAPEGHPLSASTPRA